MTEYYKDTNPGTTKYRGVCSLCENGPTCVFPRDPNRPLLHCDELELFVPDSKTAQTRMSSSYAAPADCAGEETEGFGSYMGLCKLCDKRETCVFPKPEGGVWHCEEYT
jgi:hypothetical protein